MDRMMKWLVIAGAMFVMALPAAAADPAIVSLGDDGYLSFQGFHAGTTARVQWVSSLHDPTRTNWQDWASIVVTSPTMRIAWPRFFRVTSYPKIPTNGLVLRLPFDEGSGSTAADASGSANHGTISGARWTNDPIRQTVLDFRGGSATGDFVRIAHSASLVSMQTTRQFSVSLWIKPRSIPSEFPDLVAKGGNWGPLAYGGYELVVNWYGDNDLHFVSGPLATTTLNANGKWVNNHLNEWIHVALTWNLDVAQLIYYVNGVNTGDMYLQGGSLSTANFDVPNNLYVGAPDPNTHSNRAWFDGFMDDVLIYNRALTPAEILQIYSSSPTP
jgi:hypothetical protein